MAGFLEASGSAVPVHKYALISSVCTACGQRNTIDRSNRTADVSMGSAESGLHRMWRLVIWHVFGELVSCFQRVESLSDLGQKTIVV